MDPGSKPCQEEQFGAMPSLAEVAELFVDVQGICGMKGRRDLFAMRVQVLVRFYLLEADLLIPMTRSY